MRMAFLILWVECGKVYIGKTGRGIKERMKEYERDNSLLALITLRFQNTLTKRRIQTIYSDSMS